MFMERSIADTSWHKHLRHRLCEQLRRKGITNKRLLAAIDKIPRHFFMDKELEPYAYEDRPLPIDEGQTISQPYTVAYQTQLLDVRPHDKILEIGTGSGYQCSVLAYMGAEVYTLERQKKIFDANKRFSFLQDLPAIHFFYADGYEGLPEHAPFNKILITAAVSDVPAKLFTQLRAGGSLVAPVGGDKGQQMQRFTKTMAGKIAEEQFDKFSFVPMLAGKKE
jgi:protein-L-isoaspartate(D-aspartate) O-methyltransferase